MKKAFTLLTFIFILTHFKAQTFVSGGIFTSTVWTQANSPYIVTGTLVVFPGVNLTIQPGVTIKFDANAVFEVRGKCSAIGTVNDSIVFTSNLTSPTPGSWFGIKLVGTSTPSISNQLTMEYCKGMYADRFIDFDIAYFGPYNFKHCYFAHNTRVNHDGGLPTINFEHCHFVSNVTALDWPQFGGRVSHSYFLDNVIGTNAFDRVDSCYFARNTGTACVTYGPTVGNKIINNNVGVHGMYNAVNHTFRNNQVTDNTVGVEIYSFFNGSVTFTGNTICNNSMWDIKMATNNNADLANNCWCTTNITQIKSKIYDGYMNASYGLVNVSPVAASCNSIAMSISKNELIEHSYVAPNPFNHNTTIILNDQNYGLCDLNITDIQGRIVRTEKTEVYQKLILNRNELKPGVYFYIIKNGPKTIFRGKFAVND